jgi:hypothetical protein
VLRKPAPMIYAAPLKSRRRRHGESAI